MISLNLSSIQKAVHTNRLLWKKHALERMLERGISRKWVKEAIKNGKVIEEYPEDYPLPSFLLVSLEPDPLHVVLAFDAEQELCHIITAYQPNQTYFEKDWVTRRK